MTLSKRRGTQTVDRAVTVLKALAARSATGWRLIDLAAHCNLDKTTLHRIVSCLVRHRLARRRTTDRHYGPGPLLYELGLAFPALAEFQTAVRPALVRVARELKAAALLYLRSAEDFVCLVRVDAVRVQGLSVEVGTRRPLVLSAPGIAILLALEAQEGERVLAANMAAVRRYGEVRIRGVEQALRRSRRAGLGLNLGDIVPGLWSFGVPIFDAAGRPVAAIGATGRADNYSIERIPALAALLRAEARRIEHDCATVIAAISG